MVQTINSAYALQEIFKDWDRDYYTIEAYETMLEFYDSIDENMELDVIGICGEWTEYTAEDLYNDYGNYCYSYDEEEQLRMVENEEFEELAEDILQQLEKKTIVYILSDTYLVMSF